MRQILAYTVGVQRWPFPIYKRYLVVEHDLVGFGAGLRLGLTCADESKLSLSLGRFDRKTVKVYPDYWLFLKQKERLETPLPPAAMAEALAMAQDPDKVPPPVE